MNNLRTKFVLAALLASTVAVPATAQTKSAAVTALIKQAEYWKGKGRADLANQAYRRALAIDPNNAIAKRGLSAAPVKAAPAPKPAAKPAPARTVRAPAPAKQQAVEQRPAPRPPVDRGGEARVAGFKALEEGNLASAERSFRSALAIRGTDGDALGGLGLVKLRSQRFAEAADLLERASNYGGASKWAEALGSARFYAGMNAAQTAIDNGKLTEARAIGEELVASDFNDKGPAYSLLAGIYERQGFYTEAAQLYSQMQSSPSSATDARLLRVRALEADTAGNPQLAEQLFQQGLLADTQDPWIRYEFARFLERRGRRSDAEGIRGALRNSGEPEALFAAALLSNQMDRPIDAEILLDNIPVASRTAEMRDLAVTLKTKAAIARAKQMIGQGRGGEAINGLRQLAATPDLSMGSRAALAQAVYDMGDPAGGAMIAQQALNSGSGELAEYEPIVRVLAKTGQDGLAMTALSRASEVAGQSPEQKKALAHLNGILVSTQSDRLRESGQYAQAFDLLQTQWNTAPGDNEILLALGRLYQSGGMNQQAAQTYRIVLNQDNSDKAALLGLVDAASAAGDYSAARAAADRAMQVSPDDYNVYLTAARMEQTSGHERAAREYLMRARALYTGRTGSAAGGFTANNPFASMANVNSRFAAAPAPINPFAMDSTPARRKDAQYMPSPDGYRPAMASQPSFGAPQPARADRGVPAFQNEAGFAANTGFGEATIESQMSQDPVLAGIIRDMDALTSETGPQVEVSTSYRQRSGEAGLSQLKDLGAEAKVSTDLAGGRVYAKAGAVVLDSGEAARSGLARFGRNPTAEAIGIVEQLPSDLSRAETQNASGVALSAGYENKLVKVDAGTTPVGFEKIQFAGGITVTPRFSRYSTGRVWLERRPVTDSVLAYAGTVDPVTGTLWGAVMKTGGGASYSYDKNGGGIYADGSYYGYRGFNTAKNNSIQANVGGYLRAFRDGSSNVTAGINVNYQNYDNNQNYFTFGNGGYFSPQSFLSVSFPVHYTYKQGALEVNADAAPGYQSFNQDAALIYPKDPTAQAILNDLKAENDDVRSEFDSLSKTGFGLTVGGSAYYGIDPATRVGGQVSFNTFGAYKEFRSVFGIKRQIGRGE